MPTSCIYAVRGIGNLKTTGLTLKKIERIRQLYVDEGLPCAEVAKIVGKGRATVQRQLNKLGVIRR